MSCGSAVCEYFSDTSVDTSEMKLLGSKLNCNCGGLWIMFTGVVFSSGLYSSLSLITTFRTSISLFNDVPLFTTGNVASLLLLTLHLP